MTATILDITIEQGTDFQQTFPILDTAITTEELQSASAAMQIRADYDAPAQLTLTTGGTGIAIDAVNRAIVVTIGFATTANLQPGSGVYDIRMFAGGRISRPVEGSVTITPAVTVIDFPLPQSNVYTTEDGSSIYTAEDGVTPYTQES